MTEEEKEAIEHIDKRLTIEKYTKNIATPVYISDLKTILNLIKNQQAELEKKDKTMYRMAEWIFDKDYTENNLLIHRDDYYSNCIKQVEQYFEKQVEKE